MKALRNKLWNITQEPEMKQLVGSGKAFQMGGIWINVIGDSALDKVAAEDGDIKSALRHILSVLPEPKIFWLKVLAMAVMLEDENGTHTRGAIERAAKSLGISYRNYYPPSKFAEPTNGVINGEVVLTQKKIPEAPRWRIPEDCPGRIHKGELCRDCRHQNGTIFCPLCREKKSEEFCKDCVIPDWYDGWYCPKVRHG